MEIKEHWDERQEKNWRKEWSRRQSGCKRGGDIDEIATSQGFLLVNDE